MSILRPLSTVEPRRNLVLQDELGREPIEKEYKKGKDAKSNVVQLLEEKLSVLLEVVKGNLKLY